MNLPKVDFVVCSRNNREIIAPTLEAISRQTTKDFTCTMVDGNSSDGTADFVRERFPWVKVISKTADTGPSHSRNLGQAEGTAEYVVFVDSDVTLDPNWAEAQLILMNAQPQIGIAGGKLLYAPEDGILYAAYGVMSRYGVGWDGGRAQPASQFNDFRRCLWINSSAMIVRRSLLERIGGFDDLMFLGCEDGDLGWRANLFDYHVVYNPEVSAVHQVHGTLDPKTMSRRLVHLIWRNRLRGALVNYELGSLIRYTSIFTALSLGDALVFAPRKEKLTALLWNLKHLRSTLIRREWVQSNRSVRDRDLWPLFRFGFRGPGYAFRPNSSHQGEGDKRAGRRGEPGLMQV